MARARGPRSGDGVTARLDVVLTTIHARPFFVPLALGYLKAYAEADSELSGRLRIRIDDLQDATGVPALIRRTIRARPAVLGVSCYTWNFLEGLRIAREVKAALPETYVVIGGPEVGTQAREILETNPAVDLVATREGEECFREAMRALAAGRRPSGIPGTAWRTESGTIEEGPPATPMADLDAIPSPYRTGALRVRRGSLACVETHRGCVFACDFCYYHKESGATRFFAEERVRSDLEWILRRGKVAQVYLMDPTFNENRRRAKRICELIDEVGPGETTFHAEVRAELLDEDLVAAMARSRINSLEVGLQSATPAVQAGIHRGGKREAFERGVRLLNAHRLFYELQVILGLPGETWETYLDTLRFAFAQEPPHVSIFRLMLLPGTVLRVRHAELGISFFPEPPYLVRATDGMDPVRINEGQVLGQVLMHVYNRAREAGSSLCRALRTDWVGLGLRFLDWWRASAGGEVPSPRQPLPDGWLQAFVGDALRGHPTEADRHVAAFRSQLAAVGEAHKIWRERFPRLVGGTAARVPLRKSS